MQLLLYTVVVTIYCSWYYIMQLVLYNTVVTV